MAAKDIYHDDVREALIKDAWKITDDPFRLRWGKKDYYVDLGAERVIAAEKPGHRIAVEIKSFLGPSMVDDMEKALGQCFWTGLYRHRASFARLVRHHAGHGRIPFQIFWRGNNPYRGGNPETFRRRRNVLVQAASNEQSRANHHPVLETTDLLVVLLGDPDTLATEILRELGLNWEGIHKALLAISNQEKVPQPNTHIQPEKKT